MIFIEVAESIVPAIDIAFMETAAQTAIRLTKDNHPDSSDNEATIVLTGDEQLRELNLKYLDIDAPTDVLSFPAGYTDPETAVNYLGDILISFPQAQAQAEAGGHSVEDELKLLVVHGMLHLLGYDHAEADEKAEMWAVQDRVLKALGTPLSPP